MTVTPLASGQTGDGMPIRLLHDRVLVRVSDADGERRSGGGILIPATAQVGRRLAWAERFAGIAGGVFGRRGRLRRIPGPGPVGAWFGTRDLRSPARQSFRAWWARTGGDEGGGKGGDEGGGKG